MSITPSQRKRALLSLVVLGLLAGGLLACGGPTPTPQVIVVTSTFTPTVVVQVVTATFTPTPLEEPSPEPTPLPPTDTPVADQEPVFVPYQHPSGAFGLDVPEGAEYLEEEDSLSFFYNDSLIMTVYTPLDAHLDAAGMETVIVAIMDDALVGEGLITSYHDLETDVAEGAEVAAAFFGIESEEFGAGDGALVMWQVEQTLYIMILVTPDYATIETVWQTALDSLTVSPPEPGAPAAEPTDTTAPPTDAPVQPTNTSAPKPTNTSAPKPTKAPQPTAPPALPADKGCYLMENHLGADLTVTFTAQDREWADSFQIPANESKEYCLDPGRYTYTIDAPPPWGTSNGELEVQAGDHYRWPIRGE